MISIDRIDPSIEDRAGLALELEMECLAADGDWRGYFGLRDDYHPQTGFYEDED